MRRALSVLLMALGRPISRGCWIEPLMQATNSVGGVHKVERVAWEDHGEEDTAGPYPSRVPSGRRRPLRAYPEGGEDTSRDLHAVGVLRADEIVAIRPEASAANAVHSARRA